MHRVPFVFRRGQSPFCLFADNFRELLELAFKQILAVGTVNRFKLLLEFGHRLVNLRVVAFDFLLLRFGDARQEIVLGLQPVDRVVAGGKNRQHAVVVLLRNGVVLVAVAASAADRQPHQAGGDLLHQVEEHVIPLSRQIHDVLIGAVID